MMKNENFSAPRKLQENFLDPEIQRISWCKKQGGYFA
jgi:hypothetical protein